MAKTYRYGLGARLINVPFEWLGARGLGAGYRHVLTVRGRASGTPHSTPVDVMIHDGRRYLVAGYEVTNWVKNARVAGEVELRRGHRRERLAIREISVDEAAPILRQYVNEVPITRPYFDAAATDPVEAFTSEVARHPVFELIEPVSV